jgi:hypothetical protein
MVVFYACVVFLLNVFPEPNEYVRSRKDGWRPAATARTRLSYGYGPTRKVKMSSAKFFELSIGMYTVRATVFQNRTFYLRYPPS